MDLNEAYKMALSQNQRISEVGMGTVGVSPAGRITMVAVMKEMTGHFQRDRGHPREIIENPSNPKIDSFTPLNT